MANEKLKVQRYSGGKPKEGDTLGWSPQNTGWKREGSNWVQYKGGKPTGKSQKHRIDTNAFSGTIANISRGARFAGLMPFRLAGLSPNVVQGSLQNRENLKLKAKYDAAYANLEAKKNAPRKGRLWIDPAGKVIDLDKYGTGLGGETYVNNKGELKVRSKKEVDKLKADIKAAEEKAKFNKQSFGKKLSQSFDTEEFHPFGEPK